MRPGCQLRSNHGPPLTSHSCAKMALGEGSPTEKKNKKTQQPIIEYTLRSAHGQGSGWPITLQSGLLARCRNILANALQTCFLASHALLWRLIQTSALEWEPLLTINTIILRLWKKINPVGIHSRRHCANQHNMTYCRHYSGWPRNNNGSQLFNNEK